MPEVLLASGDAGEGPPNTPLGPLCAGAGAGARELKAWGAREWSGRWSGELAEPEDDDRG